MKSHPKSRRRGVSLAEAISVMLAGSIVFGIATELLSLAVSQTRDGQQSAEAMATLDRLSAQFRDDVHVGTDLVRGKAAAQSRWTVHLADERRIEYSVQDGLVSRTAFSGNRVQAHDSFGLPENVSVRLELMPLDKPVEASMVFIRRTGLDPDEPGRDELRVTAQIGRDQRFMPDNRLAGAELK